MMREDDKWEQLQSRWAAGELLSSAQNAERLALATGSIRRERELDVTEQLQRYLGGPEVDSVDVGFVDAVLMRANDRRTPHLRLVSTNALAPTVEVDQLAFGAAPVSATSRPLWRRAKPWHGLVAMTVLAAAGFLLVKPELVQSGAAEQQQALAPASVPAAVTLARSELVFVSGDVKLNRAAVILGQRTLSSGEQLTTSNGQACVTVEPSIDVCLGPHSSVVLESLSESDVRVKVLRGQAVAALGKRTVGHRFTLTDGEVTAVARGTIFALTKDADTESTRVTVVEGRVEVSRQYSTGEPSGSTLVREHSELIAREQEPSKSVAISRNQEAQVLALVAARELWQRGELGILSIGQARDGSEVMIGQEGPFALPVSTFAPAGQQRVIVRDAQGAESLIDVEVRPGETRQVDATVRSADGAPTPGARPERKSAGGLLDEARGALKQGDSRAALGAYRRLMSFYPNSPEASTVLVTVGKLELKQNSPARALNAFDVYLRRGGPLQPEALAGKIRALRALGRAAGERAAIESYLKHYPTGFEAVALKKRLEVLSGR